MRLDALAEPLKKILEAELAAGNEIKDILAWSPKRQLLVILRRSFQTRYATAPDLEFEAINDPHYWQAEYRYRGGIQALACGFEN